VPNAVMIMIKLHVLYPLFVNVTIVQENNVILPRTFSEVTTFGHFDDIYLKIQNEKYLNA
jgi:hypothetical protein